MIGRKVGLLKELTDQVGIRRGLTKWADRMHAPAEAPGLINEAFRRLLSGRRRPVGLECAMDTWTRKAPVELIGTPAKADPCPVDEDAVERAARLVGGAHRPLIGVGGGAQDGGAQGRGMAEMLEAPVLTGRMGQGVLDGRHKLSVTMPAGYRLWGEADVVLAVGTRLQPQQQNWGMDDALKIIRIDVDSEELDRQRRPEIGIVGDATATLRVLAARLGKHNTKRNGRAAEVAETKAAAMKIVRDKPDTPVVSISGDGGFLFTAMEMATAAQHGIGVVAVVFSDGAYGNVKRIQQQAFNNRTIASDLRNPDFVKLGESFGIASERVKSPEELRAAISRGIAKGGPMLIDSPVS